LDKLVCHDCGAGVRYILSDFDGEWCFYCLRCDWQSEWFDKNKDIGKAEMEVMANARKARK
jgi:hypothetical protein